LIQRNPSHRFQTASDALAAIDAALPELEGEAPASKPATSKPAASAKSDATLQPGASSLSLFLRKTTSGFPHWAIAAAVLGIVALGAIVGLALRHPNEAANNASATATATTSTIAPSVSASEAASAMPAPPESGDAAALRAKL